MLRSTSSIQYSGGGVGLKSAGVLAQSGVASSVTGTVNETTLATIAIPANAMGANGAIELDFVFQFTGNTDSKTMKVKFGATALVNTSTSTAVNTLYVARLIIYAQNSTSAQIATAPGNVVGYNGGAPVTTALDMTQAQSITFTGQLGTSTDTITLVSYAAKLLNP